MTGGLLGNTTDRLWVDQQTTTRTVVCFQFNSLAFGGLTIVFDSQSSTAPPNVIPGTDPSVCTSPVATLSDPVALELRVGLPNFVCLTVDGTTLTLEFDDGNVDPNSLPTLEIWRDGGVNWGWIDVASCPAEYVGAVLGGPTTCLMTNERLYP